jgi:hypothetical protein
VTSASSWPWVDHTRFGSTACNWSPISDSLSLRLRVSRHLTLLQTSNSPDHYAKGTPSAACGASPALSLRPLVGTRFQILFTPHQGFFSPFPHGTCSLSVTREYLALRDGPRRFPPDFTCPVVLGRQEREPTRFRLQDCHLLWSDFPDGSTSVLVCDSPAYALLIPQHLRTQACSGLGSSPFARRYSGNRIFFLFLEVLRCLTSLRWLRSAYVFSGR